MDTVQLRDRFRGALVGAALGDALGGPFAGARYPVSAGVVAAAAEAGAQLTYTAGTQAAIATADALLRTPSFDAREVTAALLASWQAEPWRRRPAHIDALFAEMSREPGTSPPPVRHMALPASADCEPALRVVPATLAAYPSDLYTVWMARQTARVTHPHPLAVDGAVCQAVALRSILAAGVVDAGTLLDAVRKVVRTPEFRRRLEVVAAAHRDGTPLDRVEDLAPTRDAEAVVPLALLIFLRRGEDYRNCVEHAVGTGGQTHATGCLAGALSGARVGLSGLPVAWAERLENREELIALADRLATATDPDPDDARRA